MLRMETDCFGVTVWTECFSVNNGDSVSVLTAGSAFVLIMRTVCFSVNNLNRVFQC